LVDKNRSIVATGYNGFPPGVTDAPERWEKPRKYDLVVHAETNAIGRAARLGHAVYGTTCYTTHFPCLNCAKTLIAAGIEKIVFSHMAPSWEEENKKARALFQEAGVRVELLE
jgi:dCMP deaminase